MCEQTEINYLDGDIVWVKLGACWWPGQVTGFQNLPEDIQVEFQRKPLIAAVKFFQEDTYEFVKNYQQIYKYNCTLKDEFIKKGLDKYRSKSKDGASYMAKFPGDIEMAEKLTGGDPDILNNDKFSPEEKPDISALFGEKKIVKKRKDRDELRRSDSTDIVRKITHPRFLKESDHEVRIRQQPSSLPSTPNSTSSPQYPCHLCNFTSSRINVIICHIKSHRSGSNSPIVKSKLKTYSQPRNRILDASTPKRKYAKKEKSQLSKSRNEDSIDSGKRKQSKQNDKANKKKKIDPELREKLLADWDDESDDDISFDQSKSLNISSIDDTSTQDEQSMDDNENCSKKQTPVKDTTDFLAETEKLLKETEKLTSIHEVQNSLTTNVSNSKNVEYETSPKDSDLEKDLKLSNVVKSQSTNIIQQEKRHLTLDSDKKYQSSDKDDKKSRLSCFDFDEDDIPEPSILPARKIPRVFGEKNLSLKKEIIKEFEMSQALKTENKDDNDKSFVVTGPDVNVMQNKVSISLKHNISDVQDKKENEKEDITERADILPSKKDEVKLMSSDDKQSKRSVNPCDTELEIVEIFEVEREEIHKDRYVNMSTNCKKPLQSHDTSDKNLNDDNDMSMKTDEVHSKSDTIENKTTQSEKLSMENTIKESNVKTPTKKVDGTLVDKFIVETKDKIISEDVGVLPECGENSDIDHVGRDLISRTDTINTSLGSQMKSLSQDVNKKKRGRPRKNVEIVDSISSNNEKIKITKDNKRGEISLENVMMERKISESNLESTHIGKKQKSFKKHKNLESNVQNAHHETLKSDCSQQEDDQQGSKSSEKPNIKFKQEKKLIGITNNSTKLKIQIEGEELKQSEKLLSVEDIDNKNLKSDIRDKIDESISNKQKLSVEIEEKLVHKKTSDIFHKMSPERINIDDKESDTTAVTDTSKLPRIDTTISITLKEKLESLIAEKEQKEKETVTDKSEPLEVLKSESNDTISESITSKISDKGDTVEQLDVLKVTNIEMLPPKKSQIKKFELSQINFPETDNTSGNNISMEPEFEPEKEVSKSDDIKVTNVKVDANEEFTSAASGNVERTERLLNDVNIGTDSVEKLEDKIRENKPLQQNDAVISKSNEEFEKRTEKVLHNKALMEAKSDNVEEVPKNTVKALNDPQDILQKSSMQTRYKGKFTPDTGIKIKKEKEQFLDEKPVNTFQEAFLKTLQIDKKKNVEEDHVGKGKKGKKSVKKKLDEQSNVSVASVAVQNVKKENVTQNFEISDNISNKQIQENFPEIPVTSNLENIEIVAGKDVEIEKKVDDLVLQNASRLTSSSSSSSLTSSSTTTFSSEMLTSHVHSSLTEENTKTLSSDTQKINESLPIPVFTPTTNPEINMPVKKREMPRIIENVTLTEPMQILKSKLLDKTPQKGIKHKLEHDITKKNDSRSSSKAKVMKLESQSNKGRTSKVAPSHLSLTKKLQVLKAEEAETASAMDIHNDKLNLQTAQSMEATSASEKCIQQSSQTLADMELDINSMPFVLSEDVLTPESIEQMPVVISSIIPASGSIPATIAFTPTTQIISSNQAQLKLINETTPDISPTKKKSGTPAILKNKNKAKPTITSIKTLVPPLTGGIKGLKFQSSSTGKTPSLLTQKGTPGKYVVVQTSGGQQLRYSIQGKSATQQKFAISTGKGTSNAQVVQQGGKVVILTSTQSGQSKMLPLNISKTLGGKVQRIMTSKGQVFCPISPQGIITSKTIIAPKGDTNSPTTSKLSTAHKLISTQVITSKGVLTPIPGAITKTALLGTLSQGILTKGGIYTPISASALSGKTIIGSKTLVTKGTTILSPQNLGTSKAILTPISQALGAKTILSSQNIVTTKGTVLTPITGQQVKAIAAKSPSKGNKAQYQTVQPKVQLPVLQKSQKISMSSIPQVRNSGSSKSSSSLMFQSTTSGQKGTQQSKKIQQKDKTALTSSLEKVIIPRSGGRQKVQQKIMAQKMQESTMSTAQNTHSKSSATIQTNLPVSSKIANQHKYVGGNISSKNATKGYVASKSSQKNLLNIAMNSATTTTINTNISAPLSLPPLEPIEPENKSKVDDTIIETAQKEQQPKVEKLHLERNMDIEKIDETKVVTQPQIMALPTESSDGTQTYVLVTIDEQGQIQPLDNNTLMSLEGTTKNPDGTRTLYIDPSSLGEAGTLDNIVLQFDNGSLSNLQTNTSDSSQTVMSESFPTSEIIQTSNQDILAAALANTDFQQEINLPENPTGNVMTSGLTQTSLINQTILQSTIIPPTEPISSPSVLETSLTLNQPIMTPLEVPSNLPIQSESTATSVVSTIPSSLELPITITNPNISYISAGEAQIQIPGNSMPDIGEIMESPTTTEITRTDIPASTQYLVLPSLDENITVKAQDAQSGATVSYSVPLSCNLVLETTQVQTTPSMPIIDDSYSESVQFTPVQATITTEQSFVDVPVSEMLVSKASIISTENAQVQDISVTSDMLITSHEIPISSQESIASTNETHVINDIQNVPMSLQEVYPSQVVPVTTQENILQQDIIKENITCDAMVHTQNEVTNDKTTTNVELTEPPSVSNSSSMPMIDEDSESKSKVQSIQHVTFEVMDSSDIETITTQEAEAMDKFNRLSFEKDNIKIPLSAVNDTTSNNKEKVICESLQNLPVQSLDKTNAESMEVDKPVESEVYAGSTIKSSQDCRLDETSSQVISDSRHDQSDLELHFGETCTDTNQEIPSQSYEQFDISMANDSRDLPSQSAIKSENSGEPTQSANYEPMETDDETVTVEPPTQSFEHSNRSKASQSFEPSEDTSTNAPTQSFNEIMQSHDERIVTDEIIDDQSFPTQSYEIGKVENISENLETDAEISQEGNIPSQSNDIGTDGIGTSSVSTNNSGLNEDETASSSYVPETPENQERDQDQESAISTSSYEIPPCEELNIASSSVIPDTSVRAEHTSIHDNGVPEIPTSSYNLNPDITSTHVDSVPTSSYDDHVIVEQNVSTSYEVPISMPGLGGTSSQNFVTESTDHRNEPSSYYTHHQEVTASYYESVTQETNSRLEEDPQEEVTPSYYEGNPQVASQSYFTPDEATPSYSSHNVSTDYYDPRPESEASQSYYSTDDLEKTDRSSSQNIEASQSFYQERPDELRLRQQGEATPTYSERYPIDYTLDNSPIERHDLVESSVPATRPTER